MAIPTSTNIPCLRLHRIGHGIVLQHGWKMEDMATLVGRPHGSTQPRDPQVMPHVAQVTHSIQILQFQGFKNTESYLLDLSLISRQNLSETSRTGPLGSQRSVMSTFIGDQSPRISGLCQRNWEVWCCSSATSAAWHRPTAVSLTSEAAEVLKRFGVDA